MTNLPELSGKIDHIPVGTSLTSVLHLLFTAIAQLKAEGLGPGNGEVVWLGLDLKVLRNVKKRSSLYFLLEISHTVISAARIYFCQITIPSSPTS